MADGPGSTRAAAPRGAAIAVRDVIKVFDARAALHGVSLDVERGELLALLGPSGSGKTTLLRVIAGLEAHDGGAVLFEGRPTDRMSVGERGVGFVFQHYALFRHMTVLDNVSYGLRVRPRATRPPAAEVRRRALDLLDLVQLGEFGRRYPAHLSGGQRQRVALARALAIEPRVLLLDEPFGALDARVRRDLRRWLREIHSVTGQTTVFVTHDQDEAMDLADRVAILNGGRIEQVGRPSEIFAAPATAFVAGFVGDAAAVPVLIEAGRARFGGRDLGPAPAGLADGPARLFLRSADVALAPEGESGLPARVAGRAWTARGPRLTLLVEGASQAIEVDPPGEGGPAPGDRVRLRVTRPRLFR